MNKDIQTKIICKGLEARNTFATILLKKNNPTLKNNYIVKEGNDNDVKIGLSNLIEGRVSYNTFIILLDDFLGVTDKQDKEVLRSLHGAIKGPDLNVTVVISDMLFDKYYKELESVGVTNVFRFEREDSNALLTKEDLKLFSQVLENKFTTVKSWISFYKGNENEYLDNAVTSNTDTIINNTNKVFEKKLDIEKIESEETFDPIKLDSQTKKITPEDYIKEHTNATAKNKEVLEPMDLEPMDLEQLLKGTESAKVEQTESNEIKQEKAEELIDDNFTNVFEPEPQPEPKPEPKPKVNKKSENSLDNNKKRRDKRSEKKMQKNQVKVDNSKVDNFKVDNSNNEKNNIKKQVLDTEIISKSKNIKIEVHTYLPDNFNSTQIIGQVIANNKDKNSVYVIMDNSNNQNVTSAPSKTLDIIDKVFDPIFGYDNTTIENTVYEAIQGGGIGFDMLVRLNNSKNSGELKNINNILNILLKKYSTIYIVGSINNIYNIENQNSTKLYLKNNHFETVQENIDTMSKRLSHFALKNATLILQ